MRETMTDEHGLVDVLLQLANGVEVGSSSAEDRLAAIDDMDVEELVRQATEPASAMLSEAGGS